MLVNKVTTTLER